MSFLTLKADYVQGTYLLDLSVIIQVAKSTLSLKASFSLNFWQRELMWLFFSSLLVIQQQTPQRCWDKFPKDWQRWKREWEGLWSSHVTYMWLSEKHHLSHSLFAEFRGALCPFMTNGGWGHGFVYQLEFGIWLYLWPWFQAHRGINWPACCYISCAPKQTVHSLLRE